MDKTMKRIYDSSIHLWNSVGQLFNDNEKLIGEQTEITGVSTINFKELT